VGASKQKAPGLQRAAFPNLPWLLCSATADLTPLKQETSIVTKHALFLGFTFYSVQGGIVFLHLFILMPIILENFW